MYPISFNNLKSKTRRFGENLIKLRVLGRNFIDLGYYNFVMKTVYQNETFSTNCFSKSK